MHPVGFIIRMYHDARSPERQIFSSASGYGQLSAILLIHIILLLLFPVSLGFALHSNIGIQMVCGSVG